MIPQNGRSLHDRIDTLISTGEISEEIGNRLKTENQADEDNRTEMIWFCFFPPHKAEQDGIERFFRSWGGEALYNSHEDDPETGSILGQIGTPCIIEADVPISDGILWLETKIARIFLINRGFETPECIDPEGYCSTHIPLQNIRRVLRLPEEDFFKLTDAGNWDPPL